ncbi:hypothetical protein N7445_005015 [Penicillium cf. griseofulvum]|nr:hypothetical protein N7445_005015 [Penicillium cf. griseofulvum]
MVSISASFEYLQWIPLYERQKPYEVFIPVSSFGNQKNTVPRSNLVFETQNVPVQDVRGSQSTYSLDIHGFEFANHQTTTQDLRDASQVTEKYVPEMQKLLGSLLGGGKDIRTARKSIDSDQFARRIVNLEDGFDPLLPATHPHVDQSPTGAIKRVQRHLGDEAEELLKGRVRIIK